jgi:hypothetical protein
MSNLDFEKIRQVYDTLAEATLENLVAVFTRKEDQELLLVYISENELPRNSFYRSIPLSHLYQQNLDQYNGPVLGFTALDLICDDVITKGLRFYRLSRLFHERDQHEELKRTRFRLAEFLWRLWEEQQENDSARGIRLIGKIIELALPTFLGRSWRIENLVAIIPPHDIGDLIHGQATLVYVDQLPPSDRLESRIIGLDDLMAAQLSPEDWLIAPEEIRYFNRRISPLTGRFLEIRDLLRAGEPRKAGCMTASQQSFRATVQNLARLCEEKARIFGSQDWHKAAFSLMAEFWLSAEETDDLIAILPDKDFERFAQFGTSRRYFRWLPESVMGQENRDGAVQNLHVDEFLRDLKHCGPYVATYPVLHELVKSCSGKCWLNLSSVLWKANHSHSVARTSLVYARALVNEESEKRQRMKIPLEGVSDLAARACVISGLSDPWDWPRSRYHQFIKSAFQNLTEAMKRLTESGKPPQLYFYRMQEAWFSCSLSEEDGKIEQRVYEWVNQGNRFLEDTKSNQSQQERRREADRLVRIGETIQSILAGMGQPELAKRALRGRPPSNARPVFQSLHKSVDLIADLETPSSLFYKHLSELLHLLEPMQIASREEPDVDERIQVMEETCRKLEMSRHLIFALPHETAVLNFLYRHVLQQTEELIDRLQTSADLQCEPLNDELPISKFSPVKFLLKNIGSAPVYDVGVSLFVPNTFEFKGESPVKKLGKLDANEEKEVTYQIMPRIGGDLVLHLTLTGFNESGKRYEFQPKDFRVPVKNPDSRPFRPKPNPYQYGSPIQNSNLFFGRAGELQDLLSQLVSDTCQSVVIRGPRRTGKTSLLNMIEVIIKNKPGARARFQVVPEWEPRLNLIRTASLDLSEIVYASEHLDIELFFRTILRKIGLGLNLSESRVNEIVYHFDSLSGYTVNMRVKNALRLISQGLEPEQRVILLLDEFDRVFDQVVEGEQFLGLLRPIIQEVQWITWILTSAETLYRHVQSYGSPFFNLFKIVNLKDLSREDTKRLIEEPSATSDITFLPDGINQIFDLTRGHPYFIQLLCSAIVVEMNKVKTNFVSYDLVQEVMKKTIASNQASKDHFRYLWDSAKGMIRLILTILSDVSEPLSREQLFARAEVEIRSHPDIPLERLNEFSESLNLLEEVLGAIKEEHGQYSFSRPLFERWFRAKNRQEKSNGGGLLAQSLEALRH